MAVVADPPGALPPDIDDTDPFAPTPHDASHRQRYAGFDTSAFSLYSNGSPAQAKRALEAHLAETERRLEEASHLGSALVRQRSELADKLKEVAAREDEEQDIGPELRQQLVALEKEFNDVGRETARAFIIPKSRVPSGESAASDAVYETGGRDSPSKVQPPSSLGGRKQRNQASGRVNDIKLATEISSSLLNQVRELQMAYADKDDALKAALANRSQLELELEGLMQRLRALDDSEQRYKDENWTLETRVQEMLATAKNSNDREQKLQQGLKLAESNKSNVERELEELKQTHGKLNEDHATSRRQHEAEILSLKKNASSGESERATLQKKVDDLTSQNQELAKAVAYKFRSHDPSASRELTPEDDDDDADIVTPDHSPPPSPTKGTPRHGGLESETLKSSLHHAHRMIQNLKNNIHREKTEKLELRRMLQDARDELEQRRADSGSRDTKKRQFKDQIKDFKKPARPDKLGNSRGPTSEIVMDEDWEDHEGADSPSRAAAARRAPIGDADSTDAFETATENSDAFETATEHEHYTTDDGSGDLTETEAHDPTSTSNKSRPGFNGRKSHGRAQSYQSTASTTDEEFDDVRTPTSAQASQKFKIRLNRGNLSKGSPAQRSMVDANYKDSPASVGTGAGSNQSTPAGPSLFAELGDMDGSDDESSLADTPSRPLASREVSPEMQRKFSLLQQSESAEEPTRAGADVPSLLEKSREVIGGALAGGIGFALGRETASTPVHLSFSPIYAQDIEPLEAPKMLQSTAPQTPVKAPLSVSKIIEQYATEPASPVTEQERPSTAKRVAVNTSAQATPPLPKGLRNSTKDAATGTSAQNTPDHKPKSGFFGMLGLGKPKATPPAPAVAEDETSTKGVQHLKVYSDDIDDGSGGLPGLENARTPMKEIEPNSVSDRSPKKDGIATAKPLVAQQTTDDGTQTMLSAQDLDRMLRRRPQPLGTALISPSISSPIRSPTSPSKAVYGAQSPRRSRESMINAEAGYRAQRRPGSAGSVRSRAVSPPPLPADHKEAIAAATQRSSGVPAAAPATPTLGQMGPPTIPASAYKNRPGTSSSSQANMSTPRAPVRSIQNRSGVVSPVTRRSSVSSFASEIDQRFNPRNQMDGHFGFDSGADPRMIQAITQTMIGEFLWKYTRKPGRETQSRTRHRRFFWVHPYTRTLYWSEQDPSSAGRAQLKAKSVCIQSVRVISDDNPFPPGLHRKSIVVETPGREIVFTAATSGRHETWFNALSYLVLRTGPARPNARGEDDGDAALTAEDVDEFNPRAGFFGTGTASKMSRRSRTSLSSYNSATTRNSTVRHQYPTLTPNDNNRGAALERSQSAHRSDSQTSAQRGSISGRLSSLAGSVMGSSIASRYSGIGGQHAGQGYYAGSEAGTTTLGGGTTGGSERGSIYDASVVRSSRDSAEDLRRIMERQERQADRLENVRACCDGKHDVGSLSHASKRGRHASHRVSLPAPSRSRSTHSVAHSRTTSQPLNAMA